MSDEQNTPAPEQADTTNDDATPNPTETVEFWKAKAREQEKRAKDNAAAARRLAEFEDAQKTAEQKAAERVAAAEAKAQELEFRATVSEIAADHSLPVAVVAGPEDRTPEGIRAFAELVQKLVTDAGMPRQPQPDPNQGRAGSTAPTTGEQFAHAVEGMFTR